MRKDHLINQPAQLGVLGRHVRDDSLGGDISRVRDVRRTNTNIDLAFLCENEYPVFPPLDVLATDFGTEMCSFLEFT